MTDLDEHIRRTRVMVGDFEKDIEFNLPVYTRDINAPAAAILRNQIAIMEGMLRIEDPVHYWKGDYGKTECGLDDGQEYKLKMSPEWDSVTCPACLLEERDRYRAALEPIARLWDPEMGLVIVKAVKYADIEKAYKALHPPEEAKEE